MLRLQIKYTLTSMIVFSIIGGIQSNEAFAKTNKKPTSNNPANPLSTEADSSIPLGNLDANSTATPNPNPNNPANPSSDKIDVGNLEQKYWSAKDDDFTVVQNRTFSKDRKFFVSLMNGRLINDGFLEGGPTAIAAGYFLSEKHGFGIDYRDFKSHDNQVTKSIQNIGGKPSYNSPLSTSSITYMWSPIYAKVSLLERKILYLDMIFGVHLGKSRYRMMTDIGGEIREATHYGFDISQLWFFNKRLALRLDLRNTWATQNQEKYHITLGAPREITSTRLQDSSWLVGVNLFF